MRGTHRVPDELFGPLPGRRDGNVVAYEFELPDKFEPWPGRNRLERTFVLLDVGVSFANPCWSALREADGTLTELDLDGQDSWYVDLVSVETQGNRFTFRDLYIDAIVPTDGRHCRMLDLDEYADAMRDGSLGLEAAIDGLQRWQRFLDTYLYSGRWPSSEWSDFPPRTIKVLREQIAPFGERVRWEVDP
jgi:hypothetical protein